MPTPRYVIAMQTGLGLSGLQVSGFLYLTQTSPTLPMTLQGELTGIPSGSHAIGFFQYGHLDNNTAQFGSSVYGSYVFNSNGVDQVIVVNTMMPTPPASLLDTIGRMAVIFNTNTPSTDITQVLSMGVIGIANDGLSFSYSTAAAGAIPCAALFLSCLAATLFFLS